MLKITKITDYGFVLLAHIATHHDVEVHTAKDLAQSTALALPTVSKVLKILTKGGVLVSQQGSRGGYALSRAATEITAREIIEVMEGPVAITDCCSEEGCPRECKVSASWQRVNNAVFDELDGLTLAEMAKG
ncbi:MAG: SUF system Fe-S cluster assembly regulator [Kiritimatiellales bacterium]|nr:SUF system Fe-S cluster assembly regulator [Kiritimatiellales bacterium]